MPCVRFVFTLLIARPLPGRWVLGPRNVAQLCNPGDVLRRGEVRLDRLMTALGETAGR